MNIDYCYIYGSFVMTHPKLRRPNSDIDVFCKSKNPITDSDKSYVRQIFEEKYPHLKGIEINIDEKKSIFDNNDDVFRTISYHQPCHFLKLINNISKEPTFKCIVQYTMMDHIRHPDKKHLKQYFEKDEIKHISINKPFIEKVIDNHSSFQEIAKIIDGMPSDKKAEKELLMLLHTNKWITNKKCSDITGRITIDTINKKIKNNKNDMSYSDFIDICIKQ